MNVPIWYCIVKQEPLMPMGASCLRIIKAIACEDQDITALYEQHALLFSVGAAERYMPMYFHRDPSDSPLLEARRKSELVHDNQDGALHYTELRPSAEHGEYDW